MADISDTLAPKSDQLDAVELASGPRIFTVTSVDVRKGAEQPVSVHLAELDRVWRPCKQMRNVLAKCWGKESDAWTGERVELYYEPTVVYAGKTVGGTRIKRLTGIDETTGTPILEGRKPATWTVDPLPDLSPVEVLKAEWRTADPERRAAIEAEVAALNRPADEVDASVESGFQS